MTHSSHVKMLTQDARKHRLETLYACCSSKTLKESRGFLGTFDQAKNQDLTEVGVKDATQAILQSLFIPHAGAISIFAQHIIHWLTWFMCLASCC